MPAAANVVRPARVDGALRRRELPALLLSALAVPLLLLDGVVSRLEGSILVLSSIALTGAIVRGARTPAEDVHAEAAAIATRQAADAAGAPATPGRMRSATVALVGLAVLLVGSHYFVGA